MVTRAPAARNGVARWSAASAAVSEPLNLSGAITTCMELVKQSQRGGCVVGGGRERLELVDARELGGAHRNGRHAFQDHLHEDGNLELLRHSLRLCDEVVEF